MIIFRLRFILCLLIATLSIQSGLAQKSIKGNLIDTSGHKIDGAIVKVFDGDKLLSFGVSNNMGFYQIAYDAKAPIITILIEHLSYAPIRSVLKNRSQIFDATLSDRSIKLKEVTVRAPSIYQREDTLSYNLKSFIGKGDHFLKDAIKKLPGIEVGTTGAITYLGKEISRFYIEGLDLLGGKYNIATNNIPTSYVTTVQILNNHQAVKMDKDLFSDNVALNIKLSKNAKFKPLGIYEIMGGGGDNWLYELSGSGMLFTPSFQTIGTLKVGNVSEFSESDNINHFKRKEPSYIVDLFGSLSASSPGLSRKRYILPTDRSLSLNFINKLSKDETFKVNTGYEYSKNRYEYSTLMNFLTENTEIVIPQQVSPMSYLHKPSLIVEYKNNGDRRFFVNTLSANISFLKSELPTIEQIGTIRQQQVFRNFELADVLNLRWKKGSVRWSASSLLQYIATPHGEMSISPAVGDDLIQKADSRQFIMREALSASYESRTFRIIFPLALNLSANKIHTELQYNDKPASYNNMNGNNLQLIFSPQYEYTHPLRKYNFRAEVALSGRYINYSNNGSVYACNRNGRFFANPSIYFNYSLSPSSNLRLSSNYTETVGDILDFLVSPIHTSYNSQRYNSGILSENQLFTINAHYDFKRPLEMLFLNIDATYHHNHNNLISTQEVSPTLISAFTTLCPNNSDNASISAGLAKQIESIETKISLNSSYTWSRQSMAQNQEIYRYIGENIRIAPYIISRPFDFVELYYSYHWNKTFSHIQGIHKSYLSQAHIIKLKLIPIDEMILSASSDITTKDIASNISKTMALFDADLSYQYKSMRFGISLHNILNQKHYSYTLFNTVNTYTYDYRLRGRELLFSFTYTTN